ncbi:MAG TPA: hypothetical protein VF175_14720, partial [Lacipirellula sp.]
ARNHRMADGSRFNVEDPRFGSRREPPASPPAYQPPTSEWSADPPKKKRSVVSGCLIGCLITLVMLLAFVAVAAWWITQHGRDWAASLGADVLKQFIDATDLPAGEKDEIHVEIDRLAAEFREGRLNGRQLEFILTSIQESPLMTTLVASAIEGKYIAGSGLDEQEKADGRVTLRRFIRGAVDGKINEAGLDNAMQHVSVRNADGNWELRDQVSDEQLRAFFKAADEQADDAGVPPEPEEIDPSDEFKRIIDEALQAR